MYKNNYDLEIEKFWQNLEKMENGSASYVYGKNGYGKSTISNVFGKKM